MFWAMVHIWNPVGNNRTVANYKIIKDKSCGSISRKKRLKRRYRVLEMWESNI
jgi:hypothetical protein